MDTPHLYNLLGTICLIQEKDTEAEEAFKKAIELNENLLDPYLNLGRVYAKKLLYDQTIEQFEKMIQMHPKSLSSYMLLGVLYQSQNNRQKAVEYYQKALKINPKFAPAAHHLAWNYVEDGRNLDDASTLIDTARAQMPDHPVPTDTLGWIYYKKRDYEKAIKLFRESITKRSNSPVSRYHLGMAYYKTGNTDLAKVELQQALQFREDFLGVQDAREVLARLER